jgi:hypothetical protein
VQSHHASAKTIFLQEELINGSATMDVQPHLLLHHVRWRLLCPTTTAASLEPLPQIQQVECPQRQRVPPPPVESIASSCRARDIQCHWCKGFGHVMHDCSSKRVLVVKDDGEYSSAGDSMRINLLCLQLTVQVMTTTPRSILVPVMQITMIA